MIRDRYNSSIETEFKKAERKEFYLDLAYGLVTAIIAVAFASLFMTVFPD